MRTPPPTPFPAHSAMAPAPAAAPNDNGAGLIGLTGPPLARGAGDAPRARLVELRYFAGLSLRKAAAALDVSTATVGREWAVTRAWLRRERAR